MKVSCLQEQLQRGLGRVSRAVATRSTLPVLSNVLLTTDEGRLRIAATDMAVGVTTWIDASIEEEGALTVDARLLGEFVNTLPAGDVSLTTDSVRMSLTVQSGRDKATINGLDALDFPVLPSVASEGFSVDINAQRLREAITMVEFSAATDESRPVLAGVLTRFDGTTMTMASADGFRMAVIDQELDSPVDGRHDFIVPARAYREFSRIIGDYDESVRLALTPSKTQLVARVGDTEWVSSLISGTFPDVKQIVPKETSTRVDLGRETLLQAVRRSSFFARENNDVVYLTIQPGADELTPGSVEVSATAAERGNSQSFVDASVAGSEMRVAFNSHYLVDVLGVLRTGQVMIGLNGPNAAGIIRGSDDQRCTHVIMPMVIGG